MKHFNLSLVTGASSGIGEEMCRLLASKGINLIITGRNEEKLLSLQQELRSQVAVTVVAADLSIQEERAQVIKKIHEMQPDLVINNAGFGLYGGALTHSTESQLEILKINGNVVLELSLEAGRTLATYKKQGVICNISSAAGFYVFPQAAVYAASKSFVTQLSQALDVEWAPLGIRVLASCPGMVATDFSRRAAKADYMDNRQLAMSAETAAKCIWHQIITEKTVHVFDWRTRWATYLSCILPRRFLARILATSISKRIPKRPVNPI